MSRAKMTNSSNQSNLLQKVEAESLKFMDISTIYQKLNEQGTLGQIFKVFYQIFSDEHEYTLGELEKLADPNTESMNFYDHYRLNSSIFKSNLTVITTNIIEEIWKHFLQGEITKGEEIQSEDFSKGQVSYESHPIAPEEGPHGKPNTPTTIEEIKKKYSTLRTLREEENESTISSKTRDTFLLSGKSFERKEKERSDEDLINSSIKQHNKELDALYQKYSTATNKAFDNSRPNHTRSNKLTEVLAPILATSNIDRQELSSKKIASSSQIITRNTNRSLTPNAPDQENRSEFDLTHEKKKQQYNELNQQRMRPQSGKTFSSSEQKRYQGQELSTRQPQTPQSHHFKNHPMEEIRNGVESGDLRPFYSPKEALLSSSGYSRQNSSNSGSLPAAYSEFSHINGGKFFSKSKRKVDELSPEKVAPGPGAYEIENSKQITTKKTPAASFGKSAKTSYFDQSTKAAVTSATMYYPATHFLSKFK